MATQNLYDAYYFKHGCGKPYERTAEWLQFFGGIADKIVHEIGPRTVLDVGCAMGFLVEGLRERGVEAYGIDISAYALERVRNDMKPYCRLASVLEPLPQRYDLIVCIEVLEHLSAPDADRAIANLCRASDDILFSSTPFDYREVTHFNVQPPEYWAELFARYAFFRDVDFDASFITPWATRFRSRNEPVSRVVRDYERKFWRLWKENVDLRSLAGEMQGRLAEQEETLEKMSNQLTELERSRGWRLLTLLRRMRKLVAWSGSRIVG